MKAWLSSLNGTLTLSVLAFLASLGRNLLDWRYEARFLGPPESAQEAFNFLLTLGFAGGWVWAMLAAVRASRRGLMACLIFALLLNLVPVFGMFFVWCPPASCLGFPFNSDSWRLTWVQLVFGTVAAIALIMQIRQQRAAG